MNDTFQLKLWKLVHNQTPPIREELKDPGMEEKEMHKQDNIVSIH